MCATTAKAHIKNSASVPNFLGLSSAERFEIIQNDRYRSIVFFIITVDVHIHLSCSKGIWNIEIVFLCLEIKHIIEPFQNTDGTHLSVFSFTYQQETRISD